MEQSLEVESSSGNIERPAGHDTEGQLEPTITGKAPVATTTEPSQWVVWWMREDDNWNYLYTNNWFNSYNEAKKVYDNLCLNKWTKPILALVYHNAS